MLNAAGKAKLLVLLSGKGGTGKTSLSAAFAHLAGEPQYAVSAVLVDADVDAANLSLALKPDPSNPQEFWGGSLAVIRPEQCTGCGACISVCRYDAILPDVDHSPALWVDPVACDGCAACCYICPEDAVGMVPQQEGNWFQSETPFGTLFHAELFPGKENSGKLVTLVKQQARLWAEDMHLPLAVIDGPPGIGCPVISACAGADLGLILTEPGLAGLHDLERVLGVLRHFRVPAAVCINKADLYPQGTRQILEFAAEQELAVFGEIPFDEHIPQAMLLGIPITRAFPESPSAQAIRKVWEKSLQELMLLKERPT